MKYKALIFDLDDTLFDTWGQVLEHALTEASLKIIEAGLLANLEQILKYRKMEYAKNPRKDFWLSLVEKFGSKSSVSSRELVEIGRNFFYQRKTFEEISAVPGVIDLIHELRVSYKCYLVTSGNHEAQLHKIRSLGLESSFDAIYCMDPYLDQRKHQAFKKIMSLNEIKASDCLSIGNRLDNEIKEAKILGMDTCYVCSGEYILMEPVCEEERPDYKIDSILEIRNILERASNKNSA